jgi:hypothetical protein
MSAAMLVPIPEVAAPPAADVSLDEVRVLASEMAHRRALAALVPRVVLRFTWSRATAWVDPVLDPLAPRWDWPVASGASFEVFAVWSLEPSGRTPPSLAPTFLRGGR